MSAQAYELRTGEGAYRSGAHTGVLTGVAAGTATAGHIWAARWAPAATDQRQRLVVQRLRARWVTIAGPTAAQEVGLELFKVTAYTSAHTGGAALTPSKKATAHPTGILTGRIATTGALTNVATTFDTDPIASCSLSELATGAAVPTGACEIFLSTEDLDRYPLVLAPNEGLVLRLLVAMGAALTARVSVDLDVTEAKRY